MTRPASLAVLDFSGTLSPGAARFAAADRIAGELRRSGLAALGIADPDDFWEVLVNPTWERGSTTNAGYVTVLTDAAVAHLRRRDGTVDRAAVATAVQRFADRYLAASTIAPAWRPWLRRLTAQAGTVVVVATDHYAEATAWILEQLVGAGIPAVAVGTRDAPGAAASGGVPGAAASGGVPGAAASGGVPGAAAGGVAAAAVGGPVLIVNSADVGHHKQAHPFWDVVAEVVGPVAHVAVVDDFGAAEAGKDAYADHDRVARRREATVVLLAQVFAADVTPILCAPPDDGPADAVVDRVGSALVAALTGGDR